jgi:hypothetical protein
MPYVSDKQRRFFHTDTAREKGISAATVAEYDQASKGMKLPESAAHRVAKKMVAARHGHRAGKKAQAKAMSASKKKIPFGRGKAY